MTKHEFISSESGVRLDKFIKIDDMPRSQIQKLIDEGNATVNGAPAKSSYKVKCGDCVVLSVPEPEVLDIKAENIPLDIVYEDEHLLVVNKPRGMVVHPAPGNYSGTLVNALLYHCGVASFMDFNSKTSATSFKKAAKAFYSHFDYDKSLRLIKRDVCSDEEWHAILKGQLDNGRPLIYSGSDENFLNAHAFVCDGYDENDYYHFNFGWGGVMDGYFTVDFILPSLGTSTENIHDFSYKQEVLVNIFPNENGSFFYDFLYENPECFSISADTIKNSTEVEILSRFYYQGLETFKGVLFAELLDSSGHPLDTLFKSHVLIPSSSSYVKRLKFGFDLFPNGVYYISCGLKDDSGKVYKIREMQDSVAYRKFVVDFPEEDPADRFEFVYGHPSDFVVSSDSVCLGDDVIKVNCNFINLSRNAFKGSLRLDITDEEGNEVASLDSETFNMVSKGCFFYQWEFETDDIPLGDYFLEVFVLDEKGKEYEVKDRGNATSVRTFRVVPKKEPELPEPEYTSSEFVLQQESDYSISVDSVVNDRYYTTLRYNIYNSSDLDFIKCIDYCSIFRIQEVQSDKQVL